jgi:hypothetical protein
VALVLAVLAIARVRRRFLWSTKTGGITSFLPMTAWDTVAKIKEESKVFILVVFFVAGNSYLWSSLLLVIMVLFVLFDRVNFVL